MKKKLFTLALALLLTLAALPAAPAKAAGGSITVYNWGQYISDGSDGSLDVIAAFEEATGIKVNYLMFDSNETMYTKLKTGGSSYDVIIPSDYMIARLIAEDMLEELNFDNIPNYQYIDASFRGMDYDPEEKYSVPYTWGTVGLIYNTKYVQQPDSWTALWDEAYSGKILMFDNCRDAFGIAELIRGYSLNTTDVAQLEDCADLLKQQKPLVQSYVMDQIYDKMIREEAWIAPYYAGDYLQMAADNEDLAFVFPKEGFNIFVDAMCIPKGCQNKEGAEAFINFLCDPEISGQNLDYLGYSVPQTEARQYLDPETAASDIAYPSEETLANSESFLYLPTQISQAMDNLWLSVKTDGSNTGLYIGVAIAVVLIVAALAVVMQVQKKKKKARRGGQN